MKQQCRHEDLDHQIFKTEVGNLVDFGGYRSVTEI